MCMSTAGQQPSLSLPRPLPQGERRRSAKGAPVCTGPAPVAVMQRLFYPALPLLCPTPLAWCDGRASGTPLLTQKARTQLIRPV